MKKPNLKKITVIGGGTGTFTVLQGLKEFDLDLGAVVTMMDSGGSTGRLRDQMGVLPPGDLRQCLVALSEASVLWRELFLYRFEEGDLAGHNFGNLFLTTLEKVCANYDEVLQMASYILKTKGEVLPVTYDKCNLVATYADGMVLVGEKYIDEQIIRPKITSLTITPTPLPNPKAITRLLKSDYIIIGPGDIYTSIVPVLCVPQISDTLKSSKAKIIYISNLMTKAGQTSAMGLSEHLEIISKYLGRDVDIILTNTSEFSKGTLDWYLSSHEAPVINDLKLSKYQTHILEDLLYAGTFEKPKGDKLTRSLVRHDGQKIATALMKIFK